MPGARGRGRSTEGVLGERAAEACEFPAKGSVLDSGERDPQGGLSLGQSHAPEGRSDSTLEIGQAEAAGLELGRPPKRFREQHCGSDFGS